MKVHIDEQSLADTAAIILRLNPCGYSHESLVNQMRIIAERGECTIQGTLGYYVAVCPHGNGDGSMFAKAFPSAWLVQRALIQLQEAPSET